MRRFWIRRMALRVMAREMNRSRRKQQRKRIQNKKVRVQQKKRSLSTPNSQRNIPFQSQQSGIWVPPAQFSLPSSSQAFSFPATPPPYGQQQPIAQQSVNEQNPGSALNFSGIMEDENLLPVSENESQQLPLNEKIQSQQKRSTPILADFSTIRRYATFDQWFNAQSIGTKLKLCGIPFTVFILIGAVFVVIGVMQSSNFSIEPTQVISALPTTAPTPKPTSVIDKHLTVGHTIIGSSWEITLNSVKVSKGDASTKPQGGDRFLVFNVTVKNIDTYTLTVNNFGFSLLDSPSIGEDAQVLDGYSQVAPDNVSSFYDAEPSNNGDVFPGDSVRGDIVFEVPLSKHAFDLYCLLPFFEDIDLFGWYVVI